LVVQTKISIFATYFMPLRSCPDKLCPPHGKQGNSICKATENGINRKEDKQQTTTIK